MAATSASSRRILVVGSGLTGSALCRMILESPGAIGSAEIEVWEKARGAGGRASTYRFGREYADTGLQYLSTTEPLNRFYHEMIESKTIVPMSARLAGNNSKYMDAKLKHFVAPHGASSLASHMLGNFSPHFNRELADLSVVNRGDKSLWRATAKDGNYCDFDGVVLTPPVPQILALKGDVAGILQDCGNLKDRMEKVSYSSRWALALRFGPEAWDSILKLGWDLKYISKEESSSICYISIDQIKRGRDVSELRSTDEGPVILAHASVPWSLKNGANTKKIDEHQDLRPSIQSKLVKEVMSLLPNVTTEPTDLKLHKWLYSQVYHGLEEGCGAELIKTKPLLIAAGDGFTDSSGFDRCLKSATAALNLLQAHI